MVDNEAMNQTVNADPAELAKFSDLAMRWWDPDSEFKPLHQINPLRLDWINTYSPLQGQTVLDVGCGGGILSDSMARKGATVTGIDLAAKALRVAQLHALEAQTPNVTYKEIAVEALAMLQPESFDTVTCMEMLEHVPDPASVVKACHDLVKPGGWLFFSTINRNAKAYALAVVGAEYFLNILPKGTHDYAKFIKPAELSRWAKSVELQPDEIIGMTYNPLSRKYSLCRNTDVNYLMHTTYGDSICS